MLSAVLHGKKRGTGLVAVELQEAEGAEDVLTTSVFERLAYLPDSLIQFIFVRVSGLKLDLGQIERFEFWPSWYLQDARKEPDLVIHATGGRILVEAKRWDGVRQQSHKQLCNEVRAGLADGHLHDGDVLLAIGGFADDEDQAELKTQVAATLAEVSDSAAIQVASCSWYQFFQAIVSALEFIQNGRPLERHYQCIVDDIASAYHWHGLRTAPMQWLHQLKLPSGQGRIRHTKIALWRALPLEKPVGMHSISSPLGICNTNFNYWNNLK